MGVYNQIKCNNSSKLRRGNIIAFKPEGPAQWLGGRTWLEAGIKVQANYIVDSYGSSANSEIAINLKDFKDFDGSQEPYAHSKGVRKAKVSGPGLPASGIGMEFGPEPDPVTGHYWMGTQIDWNNLNGIVSENSEYEIKLYNDDLSEEKHTLKVLLSAPPFPSEDLDAFNFPTFINPSTLASAGEISIPGTY